MKRLVIASKYLEWEALLSINQIYNEMNSNTCNPS